MLTCFHESIMVPFHLTNKCINFDMVQMEEFPSYDVMNNILHAHKKSDLHLIPLQKSRWWTSAFSVLLKQVFYNISCS